MLDKNEQKFITGTDTASVVQSLGGTLYQWGVPLQQTGPTQWAGRGTQASYGMVPKVSVTLTQAQGGFFCDIRVAADFETNGIVILIVAWLFFFPVAIILAYMGYQDWQGRQNQLFYALWTPLANRLAQPPAPAWASAAAPGAITPAGPPGGYGGAPGGGGYGPPPGGGGYGPPPGGGGWGGGQA